MGISVIQIELKTVRYALTKTDQQSVVVRCSVVAYIAVGACLRRETNVEVQKPACKKGSNRIRYVAYAKQTPVEANGDLRTTQGKMAISLREGLAIASTAHLIRERWCGYGIK